ncbi:peptidoglycan editing factor PgeF [Fulvimarina sp. 2208YS6-2-32]|uniref:Purine nucleoside phosphorylase n=1 Tax=Fulvimarina uroteuthidis TaxID=3098149 RepID=A0ABU5I3Y9_9HYPH|nr:peptidoglycan editing factor PgeF [Fulvimarina sp. 2208YS6-2-32]MDY8110090.1 peptidoglycan editing factor PgeF [Fulvimarina sp. 2208YS6-2-32]
MLNNHDVVTSKAFGAGLVHGFFTRRGGVSEGLYASLNAGLGSHDERLAVVENRARAMAFMGIEPERLATPWQTHSADAVTVDRPFGEDRPKADAVVTATPGLAVGVVTADCGPILFADAEAGVVAAAHAGWKGATGGVIEATVEAMERLGARPSRITAVLGPSISQTHYEVGAGRLDEAVAAAGEAVVKFFAKGRAPDKFQFDLPGLILGRLRKAGVEATSVDICTYGDPRFFSFRRTTHESEPDYGRQLSAIAVKG